MKHIVQFSGGAASAYAGWLVAQEFGRENTILLNHNPGAEHEDTQRFLRQVSEHIGVLITDRSDGRDLWKVIEDNHALPSSFIPFCTRILKQEPAEKFYKELDEQGIEYTRIFLRVTGVRVERLQEITGRSVLAEGVDNGKSNPTMGDRWENMQRMAFEVLWDSVYSSRGYGWEQNPWVEVTEFERVTP